jgi:hypothetical protein
VGCHPVAVVTLHLNYVKPTKFKMGGLHEKHVVAIWYLGSHLSIYLHAQGNQETPVTRWPVAGPSMARPQVADG